MISIVHIVLRGWARGAAGPELPGSAFWKSVNPGGAGALSEPSLSTCIPLTETKRLLQQEPGLNRLSLFRRVVSRVPARLSISGS